MRPVAGFDADDRLVYRDQGAGVLSEQWDLSPVGDWNTFTRNGTPEQRTHGPAHEILTIGASSLTHDSQGNLTQEDKGQLLHWDADNMLTSVNVNADQADDVEYIYDALSRRIARTEWDFGDPQNPASETEVYAHWSDESVTFSRSCCNLSIGC